MRITTLRVFTLTMIFASLVLVQVSPADAVAQNGVLNCTSKGDVTASSFGYDKNGYHLSVRYKFCWQNVDVNGEKVTVYTFEGKQAFDGAYFSIKSAEAGYWRNRRFTRVKRPASDGPYCEGEGGGDHVNLPVTCRLGVTRGTVHDRTDHVDLLILVFPPPMQVHETKIYNLTSTSTGRAEKVFVSTGGVVGWTNPEGYEGFAPAVWVSTGAGLKSHQLLTSHLCTTVMGRVVCEYVPPGDQDAVNVKSD